MRLTRLFAAAALSILVSSGSALAASTVTLSLQLESGVGPTAVWGLFVQNSLSIGLGAVNLAVEGSTGFDLDLTNPGISELDSVYSVRPIPGQDFDILIINNIENGVTIAPPGATTRLGAFLAGDLPMLLPGETPDPSGTNTLLGFTLYDVNLVGIAPISIQFTGGGSVPGGLIFTVPEPAALPASVALLCLVCVLGGKIRRNAPCA